MMRIKKYSNALAIILFSSCLSADQAELLLSRLSLEQKIAQLCIIAVDGSEYMPATSEKPDRLFNNKAGKFPRKLAEQLIREYQVGGVHFIGYGTIESSLDAIQELQSMSSLPLLICQDFEWGLSTCLIDAITFPHAVMLGAITDNNLLYTLGAEIARQCHLLGVHINFAPVADIQSNPRNPVINARSFGSFKELVAQKSIAFMRGLQDNGILACAKHFCGHGDVAIDSHEALPVIELLRKQLDHRELYPFKQLIDAGVQAIMAAHIHVPALDARPHRPITLSHYALTDLLKHELNFSGLLITDALDMKAITTYFNPGELEREALIAGNDLLLMSENVPLAIETIAHAVRDGIINENLIDQKVLKLLRVKQKLGLLNAQPARTAQPTLAQFNTTNTYALQKELYESAITLVRDTDHLLPLDPSKSCALISVGGSHECALHQALLALYPTMHYCHIDKNAPHNEWHSLLNTINEHETILVALFDLNKQFDQNNGVSNQTLEFINQLQTRNKNSMVMIFGYAYSVRLFKTVGTVLVCYEVEPAAQNACATIIAGTIKARGILPILVP